MIWLQDMLQRSIDPLSRPFDEEFEALQRRFNKTGKPVRVDFRALVGNGSAAERFTHRFHPYPAKLLLNIPLFFLNCSQLTRPGNIVYDPFCGSGTVLVEALIRGTIPRGADSNPLARLITTAKTTLLKEQLLLNAIRNTMKNIPSNCKGPVSGSMDLTRWFSRPVLSQLMRLLQAIDQEHSVELRTFLQACFSAVTAKVSLADPTVPVPVLINPNRPSLSKAQQKLRRIWLRERSSAQVFDVFQRIAKENMARVLRLAEVGCDAAIPKIYDDSRTAPVEEPVDLVISSPPYASAQKYIRSSSISLQLLGLADNGLRSLERRTIGREHFNQAEIIDVPIAAESAVATLNHIQKKDPYRYHIAATFLNEMRDALAHTYSLLRAGGHCVLVIGNNEACGRPFDTQLYITEICERLGLTLLVALEDNIRSRGLITKRHGSSNVIMKETILVFRKDVVSHVR
jgi:hypothetical protein